MTDHSPKTHISILGIQDVQVVRGKVCKEQIFRKLVRNIAYAIFVTNKIVQQFFLYTAVGLATRF